MSAREPAPWQFTAFVANVDVYAPFVRSMGAFSTAGYAAALLLFVPALLRALHVDPPSLRASFTEGYGPQTREEAGMVVPASGGAEAAGDAAAACVPVADPAERAAIERAAERVAARLGSYRAAVLPHYLLIYFDQLLSKVGGAGDAPTVLGRMVAWVETCGDALFS